MIKTTTYSDLINYAYNEHGLIDGDRTQRAIDGDPNLKSEYDEIFVVMNTLDSAAPQVPDRCIEKILQFC
ncbi:MAG TPA: hypothetical protein PLI47_05205 [Bacteroidia bacterium]|nr:hypothetical protein [Bacteroidota bacterium]MBP9924329.1 hypothetical protein [Bacteroidia bacterium]MBK7430342.1 hypothetical protein [Bacteroidota bacterium]MBK7573194.1 hypothetical protein [Bacteroidota bacterium]MBK8585337.1 hypothetical protein [Bacteroidota bacterium]